MLAIIILIYLYPREYNSLKVLIEQLKKDLNVKKNMLEDELKTVVASEENNSYMVNEYKKYFENEIGEVIDTL